AGLRGGCGRVENQVAADDVGDDLGGIQERERVASSRVPTVWVTLTFPPTWFRMIPNQAPCHPCTIRFPSMTLSFIGSTSPSWAGGWSTMVMSPPPSTVTFPWTVVKSRYVVSARLAVNVSAHDHVPDPRRW